MRKSVFLFIILVLLSGCFPVDEEYSLEQTENSTINDEKGERESITEEQVELGTGEDIQSDEVEELMKKAKLDAENDRYYILEGIDNLDANERDDSAKLFIKEQYPDYFSSKETLKKSIKYGQYIEHMYEPYSEENNAKARYYQIGKLVSQSAKLVYDGVYESTDDCIAEKMQELEKQLEFFYGDYYGKK